MPQTDPVNTETVVAEIGARLDALTALKTESVRAIRREFSKRLARAAPRAVIQIALRLLEHPGIEYRFFAYELVSHHRTALLSLRAKELAQFGRGIDNWGAVDAFGLYLAGQAWRERHVPDSPIQTRRPRATSWRNTSRLSRRACCARSATSCQPD